MSLFCSVERTHMDLHRLRLEVGDHPGRLGAVLVGLGRLGIDVVEIDVHSVDGTVRIDDLLIRPSRGIDIPAIAFAVEQAGGRVVEIRAASAHELEDPVTRSMRLTACVIAGAGVGSDDALIAWCAGELVRSELACVVDARVASVRSMAGRAMFGNVAVHGREPVKRLPTADGLAWSLAVPFERAGGRAAVLLTRGSSGFARTETARVRALVDAIASRVDSATSASGLPSMNVAVGSTHVGD